jgi:hypothetical protein
MLTRGSRSLAMIRGMTLTHDPTPVCRFGDGLPAVARFRTPYGCICYPDDREQNLCGQHILRWGINDEGPEPVEVLQVYTRDRNLLKFLGIEPPQ